MKPELKLINRRTKKIGYLVSFKGNKKYIVVSEDYKPLGTYTSLFDVARLWEDYSEYLTYGENNNAS